MGWKEDLANKAANATVFEGGEYFRDGAYDLIVRRLKMNKGSNGEAFIAEFLVESSSPIEEGVTPNARGSIASVVYNTKHQATASNIKALALALAGMTEAQVADEQAAENAAAAQANRQPVSILAQWIMLATNETPSAGAVQPLRGTRLKGITYRKATRAQQARNAPRSEWNSYVRFTHVPGQTDEDRADGRAKLDQLSTEAPAPPTPAAGADVPATAAAPPTAVSALAAGPKSANIPTSGPPSGTSPSSPAPAQAGSLLAGLV